jgi:hypothetical protein
VLHGTPLWDQEASPLAAKCLEACEALKRSGHAPPPPTSSSSSSATSAKGAGGGGGGGTDGRSYGTSCSEDEVEAVLADGASSVRYPSSFAAPYSFQDLLRGTDAAKERQRALAPCLAFLNDDATAAVAKKTGTEHPVLVLGSRLPPPSATLSPPPPPASSGAVLGNSSAEAAAGNSAASQASETPVVDSAAGASATTAAGEEEEGPLPYEGNLQAAMRAQDRPAIKRIMAHNKKAKANQSSSSSGSSDGSGAGENAKKSAGSTLPSTAASTVTVNNRGEGVTALARGLKRLLVAQPHRDCAAESFMLRTRRSHHSSGSGTATAGSRAQPDGNPTNADVEDAIFVFQPPPLGAVTLAEWLSGGSSAGGAGGGGQIMGRSSAALCRRQGPAGFEALRGLLRGLLTDLQLLHGTCVILMHNATEDT